MRNQNQAKSERRTLGQKMSDAVSNFIGSWSFIILLMFFIVSWIVVNVYALTYTWDFYPFVLLNLVLSLLATIQLPIILMSQNRLEQKDRVRTEKDFETDQLAEQEVYEIKLELRRIAALLEKKSNTKKKVDKPKKIE